MFSGIDIAHTFSFIKLCDLRFTVGFQFVTDSLKYNCEYMSEAAKIPN